MTFIGIQASTALGSHVFEMLRKRSGLKFLNVTGRLRSITKDTGLSAPRSETAWRTRRGMRCGVDGKTAAIRTTESLTFLHFFVPVMMTCCFDECGF